MSRKLKLSRNMEFEGDPPKSTRSRPPRLGRAVKIMYFKCAWPPAREPLCRHGHSYINEKKSRPALGPRKEKKSIEVFLTQLRAEEACGFRQTPKNISRSKAGLAPLRLCPQRCLQLLPLRITPALPSRSAGRSKFPA